MSGVAEGESEEEAFIDDADEGEEAVVVNEAVSGEAGVEAEAAVGEEEVFVEGSAGERELMEGLGAEVNEEDEEKGGENSDNGNVAAVTEPAGEDDDGTEERECVGEAEFMWVAQKNEGGRGEDGREDEIRKGGAETVHRWISESHLVRSFASGIACRRLRCGQLRLWRLGNYKSNCRSFGSTTLRSG